MSKDGDGAEETAAEREQELRLVVETIPTPVWRAAPEGNVEYVNKRALEYFGAPPGENSFVTRRSARARSQKQSPAGTRAQDKRPTRRDRI
jgi:PAS domain-containing protein